MKQCMICRRTYDDDISYCLEDGSTLSFGNFAAYEETPTVVAQKPFVNPPPAPVKQTAAWVYPLVGIMSALIVILAFLAVLPFVTGKKEGDANTANTNQPNKNTNTRVGAGDGSSSPTATPEPPKPSPSIMSNMSSDSGRFPEGSTRLLTTADLYGKSDWDLRIMRNEIFARHGYIFKKSELRQYFSSQSWYSPRYSDVSPYLSSVEKQNAQFLKNHE